MSCSKCSGPLSADDVKWKLNCDFCSSSHCFACSHLTLTEARCTQLVSRTLMFACDGCKLGLQNPNTPTMEFGDLLARMKSEFESLLAVKMNELTQNFNSEMLDLKTKISNLTESNIDLVRLQASLSSSRNSTYHRKTALSPPKNIEVPTVSAHHEQVERKNAAGVRSKIQSQIKSSDASLNVAGCGDDHHQLFTKVKADKSSRKQKGAFQKPINASESMTKPKKHKDGVVGTGKARSDVRMVHKKSFIFVSRFAPGTSEDSVKNIVSDHCPEVVCESVQSKHPLLYSSFKITVDSYNDQKAMDPDIWPEGTFINRFFRRARRDYTGGTAECENN